MGEEEDTPAKTLDALTQHLDNLVNPLHKLDPQAQSTAPVGRPDHDQTNQLLFESVPTITPVLVWVSDASKAGIFFNKSWLDFTGRKLGDELGDGWLGGVHPEDLERVKALHDACFAQRQEIRHEYRLLRFDGQHRWVSNIATPRYVDGQFAGFSGSCVDITEVKESRAKLAAIARQQNALVVLGQLALSCLNSTVFGSGLGGSAQMYDGEHFGLATLMLRASAITEQTFDAQRVSILEFSPGCMGQPHFQYCEGSGWSPSEVKYLNENPCCLPTYCAHKNSRGDIMNFNLEVDVVTAYFEKLSVQTPLIEIIPGPGNKPYGILCVHFVGPPRFITSDEINTLQCISNILSSAIAQERAYHSLHQSEQLTRSIIDSASSGILSVDHLGNIVSINPAACTSFGFDEKKPPVGIHVSFLVPSFSHHVPYISSVSADYETGKLTVVRNSSNNGETPSYNPSLSVVSFSDVIQQFLKKSVELTGVKKTGVTFPLTVTVDEISLHNETLFTIFMKDMSNAKQLERETAASAHKSMFLSRMSHELRTPLNSVLNMSEMLLDTEPLTAEQKDMIDSVITSGNNLRALIDDILDLSKIEAGKMEFVSEPFSVRECIEHSLDVLALGAHQKNIDLLLFINEDVPQWVVGDAARLRQVFVNVIGNAIKFTDEGSVRVHVSRIDSSRSGKNECTLRFKVKDTGIGIEQTKIDTLFTDFTQAHSRSSRYGGTGLGLAISKKIIELMHGTICVESSSGTGTTVNFTARMPLADTLTITPPKAPLKLSPRVLVINNDPNLRDMLSNMCSSIPLDCDFVGAETTAHAKEFLQQGQYFDLAILEYRSKEGVATGESWDIEFAMALKDLEAKFPLVLVTPITFSKSMLGEHAQFFKSFIPKPIKLSSLRQALGEVMFAGPHEDTTQENNPTVIRDDGKVILQQRRASSFDRTMSLSIPLSILVAEDNIASQKVAKMLFSRLGYAVDIVGDGKEVMAALLEKQYDVVFMDVEMPNMDGIECSRLICSKYAEDRRPVIVAQTAHVLREDIERCFLAGMKYCIIKPLKVDKIIEILKKVGSTKFIFGTPDRKISFFAAAPPK